MARRVNWHLRFSRRGHSLVGSTSCRKIELASNVRGYEDIASPVKQPSLANVVFYSENPPPPSIGIVDGELHLLLHHGRIYDDKMAFQRSPFPKRLMLVPPRYSTWCADLLEEGLSSNATKGNHRVNKMHMHGAGPF